MRRERAQTLVLIGLAALLAIAFEGSRGLYETTEGRYAESAREMLETRQWLVPQLDYRPHWTKPPLAYWASAGGMALLGRNEWGARLPSAAAFVLAAIAVSALGKALWDARTGFAAGVIYALSPFAMLGASTVQTDMLLSLWELLAALCYWRAFRAAGTPAAKRWVVAMWGLIGVAFLTKGPPALVVLAALIAFAVYLRATGRKGPRLVSLPGIALMLAVGLTWFVVVSARTPGLLSYFLGNEVVGRIATARHGRNPQWYKPFVIFVPPLLFGAGAGLISWVVEIVKDRAMFGGRSLARLFRADARLAFLALWLLVPLVIFSLAKSRLPLYVLPILPPVALATARVTLRTVARPRFARAALVVAAATAAALLALKGWSATYRSDLDMKALGGACRQAERGETGFFAYGSSELFGLQFYLDGRLTRVADEPVPPWARRSLPSTLHEMMSRPMFETYVFVAEAGWRADIVRKELDGLGIAFRVVDSGKRYLIFACRAPSPSSMFAGTTGLPAPGSRASIPRGA